MSEPTPDTRPTARQITEGTDLSGRECIVTGGAAGLGLETSRALAAAGGRVTLAVRNAAQGAAAVEELVAGTGNTNVRAMHLDLSDLASVAAFTAAWGNRPLHVLINNAAIMACPLQRTSQGWEAQFATNHLGHFALTTGLLPALLRSAPARVVALSSSGHKFAGVDFDDIHFERREYSKWVAYGQAKSANALMTLGIHLRHGGDGITANAVNPGGIMTGLQQHLTHEEMQAMGWFNPDGTPLSVFKSTEQGAATSVWAAVAPELEGRGGLYLEDCAIARPNTQRGVGYAEHVVDPEAATRLWAVSEELLA